MQGNWNSIVGTENAVPAGRSRVRGKEFSLLQIAQTGSEVYPSLYSVGNGVVSGGGGGSKAVGV
jgi:hypothetical protein